MTPPGSLTVANANATDFLSGGGEMGARMRALDWSRTPLGSVEHWPQSLLSPLSMMLPSKAQIILFWGQEFVVFYNDPYRSVFGAKHPRMLGQPGSVAWSEVWESGPNLHGLLRGVVRTGEAFSAQDLQFVLERHGFAEETYFDVSYDPVRDESGNVGGVFCIVTETTGRVVGERRLATLKDLAEHNATARTPRDACLLAMKTLATRSADVRFAIVTLDDDWQCGTPDAHEALRTAAPSQVKELAIPNGTIVIGLNPMRPFDDRYAAFLDLVAGQLATAITNAQAYEAERRRAEQLAEIDRAKTAFFSNVSHEFRTPLTLLLGPVSELLSSSHLAAADRQALELIESNALRLHKLVNTLLDFSRIEAGRVQARFVPVDLGAFTSDVASAFRSTIERAGLDLRVECPPAPDGAEVFVDREMWEKIVLNLISNAFKHTFEGAVTVRLAVDDAHARLTVADTGVGIPPDHVDRVFDRFHRVPSARARTHEGSGIGLSLVRELVRLHGGTIQLSSQLGRGSTFEVAVPVGAGHLPAEHVDRDAGSGRNGRVDAAFVREAAVWDAPLATFDAPRSADGNGTMALDGARVLVVDDNADMRSYLTRLLSAAGAQVSLAANGRAALEMLRQAPHDVVISDVMMPVLDGFGLLTEIRADARLKTTPYIMLSARAGEESRVGGLSAGADDYLVKPFVARELIARVASQLRLARASAAERRARAEADEARREMHRVFEQAPVPICVVEGRDLTYTSANAYYRRIIGNRDPVGKRLLELWPELEGSEIHGVFQRVLSTGEPYSATEFNVRFDQFGTGERRDAYFNFVYHPLRDVTGAVYGTIAVATDVTPQVLARREAERLREAAEAANEAKLHLLRTVSHETRQPVHASLGYLDLLSLGIRGSLTDAQRSDIENIRRNQTHLLRLLNDILSFAKLEAGALELDLETADASTIVDVLEPLVGPQFRAKGVTYSARRSNSPALFRGDRERTVQVCVNLLTNALKATPEGGQVTIACEVHPERVALVVSDTGIGIPASKLDGIFDPFTQLARARPTADAHGVGLGLSISRQLARAMNGDLTVESTEGVGSTFTFSLPRA